MVQFLLRCAPLSCCCKDPLQFYSFPRVQSMDVSSKLKMRSASSNIPFFPVWRALTLEKNFNMSNRFRSKFWILPIVQFFVRNFAKTCAIESHCIFRRPMPCHSFRPSLATLHNTNSNDCASTKKSLSAAITRSSLVNWASSHKNTVGGPRLICSEGVGWMGVSFYSFKWLFKRVTIEYRTPGVLHTSMTVKPFFEKMHYFSSALGLLQTFLVAVLPYSELSFHCKTHDENFKYLKRQLSPFSVKL